MAASTQAKVTVLPVEHTDPLIGRCLAERYRVLRLIAAGGMGRVYEAEQQPIGRRVALKILTLHQNRFGSTGGFSSDPSALRAEGSRRRFLLEASSCAKLTHPNTVTLFDFGETDDNVSYIAMELLEGWTLRDAMDSSGPMEPERVIHITAQICASLREAHSHDIVHRDLKPGNVFLLDKDEDPDFVKVLDFGIVKAMEGDEAQELTETGSTVGSPRYMAPEQVLNKNVDGRADVYAIGVLMFEMLTGRVPFECQNAMETMLAHLQKPAPRVGELREGVPPALEDIVSKALKKDADDRFSSVSEMYETLARTAGELSLNVPSASMIGSGPRARPTFNLGHSSLTPEPALARTVELSADDVSVASRRGLRLAMFGVGAVLVGAMALAAWQWSASQEPVTVELEPQTLEPELEAPEPVSPALVPVEEPEAAPPVEIEIASRPAGARVFHEGGEVCATTPCTISLPAGTKSASFQLRRAGFFPEDVELTVDEETQLDARLRPIPKRKPKRAKPAVPRGYKANPYE